MSFTNRNQTRPGTTRRVRLKDYDYSQPGFYFVTICTYERRNLFGSISGRRLHQSYAGEMVTQTIQEITKTFDDVSIDSFVVMPNHVHVLIGLAIRTTDTPNESNLTDVVQWLKSTCHRRYVHGVKKIGWPQFPGKVWQTGYHDHIVRNERELEIVREYVSHNVERWEQDQFFDDDF